MHTYTQELFVVWYEILKVENNLQWMFSSFLSVYLPSEQENTSC